MNTSELVLLRVFCGLPFAGIRCGRANWLAACLLLMCATGLLPMAAQAATTLKIAAVSPEGSVWMKYLRAAGKSIDEGTQGRVQLKFYPGGVMGDDKAVLRKIRTGQLHGATFTSGGLVGVDSNFQLYSLPLAFDSREEADAVRKVFDQRLIDALRGKGFEAFGIAEIGFANIMSLVPASGVAEVRKRKVWVPDNDPGATRLLNSFGINGTPLSIADVLTGLQTGLIDTIAAPPVGAIALQWYTQVKHAVDMPLMYVYGTLAIQGRAFNKLSEADRIVVRKVLADAVLQVDTLARKDDASARAALGSQGIAWMTPAEEQKAEWRSLARTANDRFAAEGFIDAALYADFQAELARFRAAR
jgi:TRAP-type C4-dicarboxylate transport system substrate-binding protein